MTLLFLIAGVLCFGCGTGAQKITDDQTVDEGLLFPEVGALDAVVAPEIPGAETLPESWIEIVPDVPFSECDPGEGCFLDKCSENSDCQSGWCVEHMGEGTCTQSCKEECPPGWTCKQLAETDPDVVYICVSDYASLCKPCSTSSDCKTTAGAEDVCVNYGADGKFCGGTCGENQTCPSGFSCLDVETVGRVILKQCVSDTGLCSCTDKSISLGLFTACFQTNEWGTCEGKRVCTQEGLTDCDAGSPAQEACNGQDDNCDGDVDEPQVVEGDFVNLCDDANDCTKDSCKGDTGCEHDALDSVECVDGNMCTTADQCAGGICVGAPVNCDDANPCTDDACEPSSGCTHTPNALPCNDGNPCTKGDQCLDGLCVAAELISCDDGNPCTDESCDPAKGCTYSFNTAPCDDGDDCTSDDLCDNGLCKGGPSALCNDGDPCTDDLCTPDGGCDHPFNKAPCDDGNICTHSDQCTLGECKPGGFVTCDDGNQCTDDSCDPLAGCVFVFNFAPCDDGNPCTKGDHCDNGWCKPGGEMGCDDGNPCTDDSCDPVTGCSHANNSAPCDDGDACTQGDACAQGACSPGELLTCNDGNPCTNDTCDPNAGCINTPVVDGTPCGGDKTCTAGICVDGPVENGSKTLEFTGNQQSFIVPNGVSKVTIEVWGAQGGGSQACSGPDQDDGGRGGYAKGNLAVTPGETLHVYVGGKGQTSGPGGFNGGGNGGQYGGGGGGGTDVRKGGQSLDHRVIVAGGGAGGQTGCPNHGDGGHGGGLVGETGKAYCCDWLPGEGGGQNSGGAAGSSGGGSQGQAGTFGQGAGSGQYHISAGGGGWYGGGSSYGAGGGGGSAYYGGCTNGTTETGGQFGHGKTKISW